MLISSGRGGVEEAETAKGGSKLAINRTVAWITTIFRLSLQNVAANDMPGFGVPITSPCWLLIFFLRLSNSYLVFCLAVSICALASGRMP
jgi:hypothetical protein